MCLFLFPYCFNRLGISLNVLGILCFVVMLLGATLIQAAFMIVAGSMSFLIVRSQSVVEAFIYDVRRIIKYPISIYPFALQLGLTCLVAYKLFYVGCSRARKNLSIILDAKKITAFKTELIGKLSQIGFIIKEK